MPNNGIISRYANVPDEFKVSTTNDFDNSTDTIVVNKAVNGIKVEQKAVTLNQLAGMVGGGSQGPQGVQGPQGPAGPTAPAGLTWGGEYAPEQNYAFNEVLTYVNPATDVLGSYWVTDPDGIYNVNPTDGSGNINEGWAFLASQGPQGIQGPQGPQGNVGPQGSPGVTPENVLSWVGTHSVSNAYPEGSVVKKTGSGSTAGDYIYYALIDVASGVNLPTLGTSNASWQLIGSYGTGVTGIAYSGGVAKGNISLIPNPPALYADTQWKLISNSGGSNQIGLAITKPYIEFGGPIYFNGASSVSNSTFMVQDAYVNDTGLTNSNITISAVSGQPGTYQIVVNQFFDSFNFVNNIVSIELNDGISLSSDVFMVKYAYDSFDDPTNIKFKMLIFSAGSWIPWTSGSQTPRLNVYLKRYNN